MPRLKVSSAVLPIIEINFGKITQSEETVSVFAKDFLYFLNKWVLVDRGRLARGSKNHIYTASLARGCHNPPAKMLGGN